MYWYVCVNGEILPTPYKTMEDCIRACREIQDRLGSCITEPVLI